MNKFKPLMVENLRVAYGKADVLCGVSLDILPGKITCLLGSNGAGKTTLIRSLVALRPHGRAAFSLPA